MPSSAKTCRMSFERNGGGVENRRNHFSLPVDSRFGFRLSVIEPDQQISRIRLPEKTHAFAHGRLAVRCGNSPVSEAPFQFVCDVTEEESMYSWLS